MLKRLMGAAQVAGALALSGCGWLFPASYRFPMTVVVDTPAGVRSGSSVLEVACTRNPMSFLPDVRSTSVALPGEAAAVDLPGSHTLFALLTPGGSGQTIASQANDVFDLPDTSSPCEHVRAFGTRSQRGRKVELKTEDYPLLVSFALSETPTSVEAVNPANLAGTFGPDVRLRGISVEVTGDAVTSGINDRLSWLEGLKGGYLHGSFTSRGAPLRLSGDAFKR